MSVSVEIDIRDGVSTKLGAITDGVARELARTVLKAAHQTAAIVSRVVLEKMPGGTSELARSFPAHVGFVEQSRSMVSARTYSDLPYARIQDQGGVVKPRTAKALAIPLSWSAEAKHRWPRDWAAERLDLIVLRGKAFLIWMNFDRGAGWVDVSRIGKRIP